MAHPSRFLLALGILVLSALMAQAQDQPQPQQMKFPDLVAGLRATPGCLGVETARTSSGKNVIFAWFEDKKAALRWYTSEMHQQVMRMTGPLPENRPAPLAGVPSDSGPIMAIASLTPAEKSVIKGLPFSISQIAIELYQPLPGGVFVGGRFAPKSVKVSGMRDYTPAETDK